MTIDPAVLRPQDHLEFLQAAREMATSSTCVHGAEGCVIVDQGGYHQGSGFKQSVWKGLCDNQYCRARSTCKGRHAGLMAAMMAMRERCYLRDAVAYLVSEPAVCLSCVLALEEAGVRWVVVPGDSDDEYKILPIAQAAEVAA